MQIESWEFEQREKSISFVYITQELETVIIIIAEMAVLNVASYLIEERRRWPVITASPRGQYSK